MIYILVAIFYKSEHKSLLQRKHVLQVGHLMEKYATSIRIQTLGCITMQLMPRGAMSVASPEIITSLMNAIVRTMTRYVFLILIHYPYIFLSSNIYYLLYFVIYHLFTF